MTIKRYMFIRGCEPSMGEAFKKWRRHVLSATLRHDMVATIVDKGPWDTCRKLGKVTALSAFQPLRLAPTPCPLKQCYSVPETLRVIVDGKNFPLPHALLPKTNIV